MREEILPNPRAGGGKSIVCHPLLSGSTDGETEARRAVRMEKCSSRTTGGGEGGKGWGEENKKSRAEGVSHLHATERSDAEPTAGGAPGGSDTAG